MIFVLLLLVRLSMQQNKECKFEVTTGRNDQYMTSGDFDDDAADDTCTGKSL